MTLLACGTIGVIVSFVVYCRERGLPGAGRSKQGHSRISATDDDDDDDDDDGQQEDDEHDSEHDDKSPKGGSDDEEEATEPDLENGRPETMKAFVALDNQIHTIVLPLVDVDSWATLSQTIHETCEDSGVPDLPVHGIMHIVLNVKGKTVPVTGITPFDELWKARAIKVSITDDDARTLDDGRDANRRRKKKSRSASRR